MPRGATRAWVGSGARTPSPAPPFSIQFSFERPSIALSRRDAQIKREAPWLDREEAEGKERDMAEPNLKQRF